MTAMAALLAAVPALAAPQGGSVVAGSATIAVSGTTTNINQSTNSAIINWQGFSIAPKETVNFNQSSSTSVTLNRVIGNEQSIIAGALNANGQVFIVNSAGVVFTKGAQVNVGGIVDSTLEISNANFMAGNYTFSGASTASVVNNGHITAAPGGYVALLGNTVSNNGVISARLGTVTLASGQQMTLNFGGNSLVDVTIDKGTYNALVANKGLIKADGGKVIMTAKAADAVLSAQVNNSGIVQARTIGALLGGGNGGGTHVARRRGTMQIGAIKQARTGSGTTHVGAITLIADGGTVTDSGTLDASAKSGQGGTITLAANSGTDTITGTLAASAMNGTGGTIIATGTNVDLGASASLAANGLTGGIILVGGDRHGGSDPAQDLVAQSVPDATITTVEAGATLSANGSNGNGGSVVVWSNEQTNYAGSISATGGAASGNGGFAEVSSESVLNFNGTTDLSSANGATGTLLLDPYSVSINSNTTPTTAPGFSGGSPNTYTPTANSSLSYGTIKTALNNANVIITTGSTGSTGTGAGVISVNGSLSFTSSNSLTLQSAGNISLSSGIVWGGGSTLTLDAGPTGTITTFGQATLRNSGTGGSLVMNAGAGITLGASVSLGSASFQITSATGNIAVNGAFSSSASGQITATAGSVTTSNTLSYLGTGGGLFTLNGATGVSINGTVNLGSGSLTATSSAGPVSLVGSSLNWSTGAVQLTSTTGPVTTAVLNQTGTGSLTISARTDIDLNGNATLGAAPTILIAGGNININSPLSWSGQTLNLTSADNIYINANITGTVGSGTSVGLTASTGTGTNPDGSAMGIHMGLGSLSGYSELSLPDTATVSLNGTNYAVIASQAEFDAISSNLAGHYVLGADLANISFSELQAFGLSNTNQFDGTFNGFGHSLTLNAPNVTPTSVFTLNGLNQTNVVVPPLTGTFNVTSLGGTSAGGMVTYSTTGDIDINTPLTFSSTSYDLSAGGNLNINAPITVSGGTLIFGAGGSVNVNNVVTVSNNTSLGVTYNTATNGAPLNTPLGGLNMPFATGTTANLENPAMYLGNGQNFAGRIDFVNDNLAQPLSINGSAYTLITSWSGLTNLSASGNYALANNLAASGTISSGGLVSTFSGNLNGLGHTITGLTGPLFGQLGTQAIIQTATVSNLGLVNVNISGGGILGALVTTNYGNIINDFATGSVTGTGMANYVGGLVGYNDYLIYNSYTNVAVSGTSSVGGIAGADGTVSINSGSIVNSYAMGNVIGSSSNVGGLVGSVTNAQYITNDFYQPGATSTDTTGVRYNVEGTTSVGGLIGSTDSLSTISNSFATGTIVATDVLPSDNSGAAGGLMGSGSAAISNSQAINVNVTGGNGVGGLVGSGGSTLFPGLTNVSATGTVTGYANVGGLVGGLGGYLTNATANVTVASTGGADTGGLAGGSSAIITNATATGSVTASGNDVGGLVGYENGGSIYSSSASGTVRTTGDDVGGLVGYIIAASSVGILNSSASGAVFGGNNVGGLIGSTVNGYIGTDPTVYYMNITGSTATGNITSTGNYTGGLLGNSQGTTIIAGSTASGNVSSQGNYAGSLVGAIQAGLGSGVYSSSGTGAVSGVGANVGGLIGYNNGAFVDSSSISPNSGGAAQSNGGGGGGGGGGTTTTTTNTGLVLDDVESGTATIVTSGNTTTITSTTPTTIIEWTSFSIPSTMTVVFNEPSATAAVLNQVVGTSQSLIQGALSANGRLFIVNSNGILFGSGSSANATGLVASTLPISYSNFLSSNYAFTLGAASTGSVTNQGNIIIATDGFLALTSQNGVTNSGNLIAPDGKAILASANGLTLNLNPTTGALTSDTVGTLSGTSTAAGIVNVSGTGIGQVELDGSEVDLNMSLTNVATLTATATNNANINAAQTWTNNGAWTFSGTNINVNDPVSWSAGTLTLNAGQPGGVTPAIGGVIKVNAPMTPSTNTTANTSGMLVVSYDTATNGAPLNTPLGGMFMAFGTGTTANLENPTMYLGNGQTFAGYIDLSNNSLAHPLTINGSQPNVITSWSQLTAISSSGNYVLAENLTASGTISSGGLIGTFTGTLNGLGHTITGLTGPLIGQLGTQAITQTATVSNLGLVNVNINGGGILGTLVDDNYGNVINDFASGTLTATANYVGGLVGVNDYLIYNSYANVAVSSSTTFTNVGGLAGSDGTVSINSGTIVNSYAMGNVISAGSSVGGLVGSVTNAQYITNDFYQPGATSTDTNGVRYNVEGRTSVGGLIGSTDSLSTISNSFATGTIVATDVLPSDNSGAAGGLMGSGSAAISNSQAINVNVTGGNGVGGLVGSGGSTLPGLINVSATGTVTGYANVGGLAGAVGGVVTNAIANVTVTSTGGVNTGGLAGSSAAYISNSSASGSVTASGNDVGGLVGWQNSGGIFNSSANGTVRTTGDNVGGLIGYIIANSDVLVINSSASGAVFGGNNVGGLIGSTVNGNLGTDPTVYYTNLVSSSATGNVTATGSYAGGLLGSGQGTTIISGSSATGNVSGQGSYAGGLIGGIQGGQGSGVYDSSATGAVFVKGVNADGLIGQNSGASVDSHSTYVDIAAVRAAAAAAAQAAALATDRQAAQGANASMGLTQVTAINPPDPVAGTAAGNQAITALGGPKIDDAILNTPPATTSLPTEQQRRRRVVNTTPPPRRATGNGGGGAAIRSIEINGERFRLER